MVVVGVQLKLWSFSLYTLLKTFHFSAENCSSLEADNPFIPSPKPRTMLKKQSHREEKEALGEEKETALHEELEAHCAPLSLPRLNGRQLEAEEKAFSENLDPEVSTTVELLNRVLEFRPLHLIKREREKIFVYMHVCVCYIFFQQLIRK